MDPSGKVSRRLMMQFQSFVGPIPPPEILGHYEQVCAGSADRIITQFEEQGRHRRVLEKRALNHNIVSATIGQVAGFFLFLVAIGGGVFLLYNDKSVEGIASIVTAVGGAAWVLGKAEQAKKKDLAQKREEGKRK